ncbi:MAG: putative ABC transporter permease [Roseburia sp.]
MGYTGYELLWLFFIYSFLGWVLETVTAAAKQKRFVNRGLINSPFCVIYGFAAVVISVYLQELSGFWLFLGSAIFATVIEWVAGHLIERLYHEKWWDYSSVRWNLDGYICLPVSALWGGLGFAAVRWGNPLLGGLLRLCPALLARALVWALAVLLAMDAAATLIVMSGKSRRKSEWAAADAWFARQSARLGTWLYDRLDARIRRAYPGAEGQRTEEMPGDGAVFACGCGFYKIVMLFFIGAFLGDLTETVFCRVTAGVWMSRSSVVWGPFSIVWGLAIAAVTALLYKYRDRSDGFLFWIGTLLGGAYEYLCSVFTELAFGTVFWDYSHMPFNLGGRINLLYCFFWGIAAVVWFKKLYPFISSWIERIPVRAGKIVIWILILFMSCNVTVSCMALKRYEERRRGIKAEEGWEQRIDAHFPDARMERIYPNALSVE